MNCTNQIERKQCKNSTECGKVSTIHSCIEYEVPAIISSVKTRTGFTDTGTKVIGIASKAAGGSIDFAPD